MSSWMETMFLASRDAAVLALLVGCLLLCAGRFLPAGWRHGLWLLVAVRLLMPVLPTGPLSWQRILTPESSAKHQVEYVPSTETPATEVPTLMPVPERATPRSLHCFLMLSFG